MMNRVLMSLLFVFVSCISLVADDPLLLSWDGPGNSELASMPAGNGEIGVNVWTDNAREVQLYVGKNDAWGEHGRLLKVGKMQIISDPPLFAADAKMVEEVNLKTGTILISSDKASVRVWVDANSPTVHVEAESVIPVNLSVQLDLWRTTERALIKKELNYVEKFPGETPKVYPDVVVDTVAVKGLEKSLVWYHRNNCSVYDANLKHQSLENFSGEKDPLLNRTFGCSVAGNGFKPSDPKTLQSVKSRKTHHILITPLTKQTETVEEWFKALAKITNENQMRNFKMSRDAHLAWWHKFWDRSHITVSGGGQETDSITKGWYAHRYLMGCAGRGTFPIKFNGSMFTVAKCNRMSGQEGWITPDYRNWGAPFWCQNQRHIYWPMLEAGDYELMLPFFKMYMDALAMTKYRIKTYYNHDGAIFPETMMFWGTPINKNYGWNRTGKKPGDIENGYIKRYWQGSIELLAMMLKYYDHTRDSKFVSSTLLPYAKEIITFYDQHYTRDDQGKIKIYPAQLLESIWDAENPMPEIAGLRYCLPQLMEIPETLRTADDLNLWKRIYSELPALPKGMFNGKPCLIGAEKVRGRRHNAENGRLYAVWPYRLYGVGCSDFDLARNTWDSRPVKKTAESCWHNNIIWAARVGLTEDATHKLAERFVLCGRLRFPAFYIKGDWVPDHDNGGVCSNTLQTMLLQDAGGKIHLFPAWPKTWDVHFKLHTSNNTVVEVDYKDGKVVSLNVSPKHREKDIILSQSFTQNK